MCHIGPLSETVWIAGNNLNDDPSSKSNYKWFENGEPFSFGFTNWPSDQPDNKNGEQHCVRIVPGHGLFWDDENCANQYYFLCEAPCGYHPSE